MTKNLKISEYSVGFLLAFFSIVVQLFILKKIGIAEIIIGINGIIFVFFVLLYLTNKIYNILIVFYFLPLLILSNPIHYSFKIEIVFALPLILLALYTLFMSLFERKKEKLNRDLSKSVLIFLGYFLFSAVLGIFYGNSKNFILVEGFHFLLFGSIVLFMYNLTKREDYYNIFKMVLVIAIIISLEYIFLGAIISGNRFVTFQSGFLPIISGILFAYFLRTNNNIKRILAFVLIGIVILAMISTLTRSLWVTTLITLGTVYVIHLWATNKLTTFKKTVILVLGIASILVVLQIINNTQAKESLGNSEKVADRAQSIANPTEDHSFLMRVELGWYAIQKISEKPIIGWGLGDFLNYQVLADNSEKVNYLDNTWFYFFWKGGIIGFLLIAFVFYRSITIGLKIIVETDDENVKILIIGFLAGLVGIIALGFLSPLVIKYRTTVIFPLIWAYFEFEYNKLTSTKEQLDL